MRPKFVIFDCDGVLVDSEPITNHLLRDDLAARGLDLPYEEVSNLFVGGTMKSAGETAQKMGAAIPSDWISQIYANIYAALAKGTPMIAGVDKVLDQLDAAEIPYAVGSNGAEEKMHITLGQHPSLWRRLQSKLYSAHTLGVAKPDPGLYLAVARDARVPPSEIVVVDDSPSGCIAARDAGMQCIGFAEHDDGARLSQVGAKVVHSMADVVQALGLPSDGI